MEPLTMGMLAEEDGCGDREGGKGVGGRVGVVGRMGVVVVPCERVVDRKEVPHHSYP